MLRTSQSCARSARNSKSITNDQHDDESENLLATIEQVQKTLSVMTSVASNLREQLHERLEEGEETEPEHMSAEEHLKQMDNPNGVWH